MPTHRWQIVVRSMDGRRFRVRKTLPMQVTRTGLLLRPNNARVLYRPFDPAHPQRAMRIIGRVMALPDDEVARRLCA